MLSDSYTTCCLTAILHAVGQLYYTLFDSFITSCRTALLHAVGQLYYILSDSYIISCLTAIQYYTLSDSYATSSNICSLASDFFATFSLKKMFSNHFREKLFASNCLTLYVSKIQGNNEMQQHDIFFF